MHRAVSKLLDLLYPRRCPACHKILRDQKRQICPECAGVFHLVTEHYCLKCGMPVKAEEEYCRICGKRERAFDQGRSVFLYSGDLRQSLVRYKYHGAREYGAYYAAAICHYRKREIQRWEPDVIVPIPLARRKERLRGFNQSGILADEVGKRTGIPVSHAILTKIRDTVSQKKLDAAGRRQNLKNAFQAACSMKGARVLLIDDVYTTGSTLEEAAACLKAAGAEKVYFLTVCSGQI